MTDSYSIILQIVSVLGTPAQKSSTDKALITQRSKKYNLVTLGSGYQKKLLNVCKNSCFQLRLPLLTLENGTLGLIRCRDAYALMDETK